MRVSCAVDVDKASATLLQDLIGIGVQPIVTTCVIRAVYEGPEVRIGQRIVNRYELEHHPQITVDYAEGEEKQAKKFNWRELEKRRRGE